MPELIFWERSLEVWKSIFKRDEKENKQVLLESKTAM